MSLIKYTIKVNASKIWQQTNWLCVKIPEAFAALRISYLEGVYLCFLNTHRSFLNTQFLTNNIILCRHEIFMFGKDFRRLTI